MLLEEAVGKGYSECEPCEELRSTILEAERCAKLASQMTTAKHRGSGMSVTTRGTLSLASVGEKRMDVDELVKFLEQVECLPCKVPEASILQVCVGVCACVCVVCVCVVCVCVRVCVCMCARY